MVLQEHDAALGITTHQFITTLKEKPSGNWLKICWLRFSMIKIISGWLCVHPMQVPPATAQAGLGRTKLLVTQRHVLFDHRIVHFLGNMRSPCLVRGEYC